ncbi:MAG TPA: branched-chain amino acid ABC transporter substrate-binding protein [Stellaceae bacterium]|nr:branched-chain amino acid ABC transporter substrate-binding protein [Stellaceae bacterium]
MLLAALTPVALPGVALPNLAHADILFGVALPLSGQLAAIGEQIRHGTTMAADAVNEHGGIRGQKLVLQFEDDACDPRQAVAVANRMTQAHIDFVVGHVCSGASIAASDVYHETGILMMTPASNSGKLTDRGLDNIFRVCGRDDQQGAVAARIIADKFPGRRIAIIHDKGAFGKGLADATKTSLNQLGITEVIYDSVNAGESDFSALISKLKQARIGLIYYGGYQVEAGNLVRQADEQGLKAQFFGTSGITSSQFWAITGPAGNGALFTFNPDPRRNPEAASAVAAFRSQNIDPEGFTLYAYAAVQAFAAALDRADDTTPLSVAKALRAAPVSTVLGSASFDAKGDLTAPGYRLYEWRDGKFDYSPL